MCHQDQTAASSEDQLGRGWQAMLLVIKLCVAAFPGAGGGGISLSNELSPNLAQDRDIRMALSQPGRRILA